MNGKPYRSPYEAYPFLADRGSDLRCDFELLTDAIASETGLLRAETAALYEKLLSIFDDGTPTNGLKQADRLKALAQITDELGVVCELVYHANPTLRTHFSIKETEVVWLEERLAHWQQFAGGDIGFVLPMGCRAACVAHGLRVQAKCLVRLLYRYVEDGGTAPERLVDFCSLLSGYFFMLALALNRLAKEDEHTFISRNYG